MLGHALIPALLTAGHAVDALAVSDESAAAVARQGARPVRGNLLDPAGLPAIDADVVAHFATSIPRPDRSTGS
ncbi:MAG TPA: NAD(P)-dependent oxidoreductase, partial [Chloroflexota bacterium]|nr:NAD(P)-dependent oxidoreductase [Chloroflexota bacterium]